MTGNTLNRYEIDEKNAIIALQAILTNRGVVPEEKYQRFGFYMQRLPPYRALLVYGHAMYAIANRLEEGNPHRDTLKGLGDTITTHISADFPEQVEQNPEFFEAQRLTLADNFNKLSTLMQQFRDRAVA